MIAVAQVAQQVFESLPATQESISAPALLLGAYGFVWAAVFAYVWTLWRRLGRVEHELADVNAQLAKRTRA